MKRVLSIILFSCCILIGWHYFYDQHNTLLFSTDKRENGVYVKIPTGSTLYEISQILYRNKLINSPSSFVRNAQKYGMKPRSGRFFIKPGQSHYQLIRFFKEGKQSPVTLVLHGKRTKEEVAQHVSKVIEASYSSLMRAMNDPYLLARLGFNSDNILAAFIPNSYELYWNTNAKGFLERMVKENKKFWTYERLEKVRYLGITPSEAMILASIVEKETNKTDEKGTIARVYLNRLQTPGWRLDADPTVVYAWRDKGVTRLEPHHYKIHSRYNTYIHKGLPPGPICMPSIETLDETLNAAPHDYMFFCARPDGSGYHNFSISFYQHKQNAKAYRTYIAKREQAK